MSASDMRNQNSGSVGLCAAGSPAKAMAETGIHPNELGGVLTLFLISVVKFFMFFGLPTDRPPELKAPIVIPNLLSWMAFGDLDAMTRPR